VLTFSANISISRRTPPHAASCLHHKNVSYNGLSLWTAVTSSYKEFIRVNPSSFVSNYYELVTDIIIQEFELIRREQNPPNKLPDNPNQLRQCRGYNSRLLLLLLLCIEKVAVLVKNIPISCSMTKIRNKN